MNEDGSFTPELKKYYKVVKAEAASPCFVELTYHYYDETHGYIARTDRLELAATPYRDSLRFAILAIYRDKYEIHCVVDWNGAVEDYTVEIEHYDGANDFTLDSVKVVGTLSTDIKEVYLYNEHAEILVRGENGASAYEVAVAEGFEGSEAEWLASLKGETGAMGRDFRYIMQGSANLLNCKSADIIKGSYIISNGNIGTAENMCISSKIAVSNGETYCVTRHSAIQYGTLGGIYDANDNFLSSIVGEPNTENTAYVFTISSPNAAYIRVNAYFVEFTTPSIKEYMVVRGTEYPSEYIPFWAALTEDFSLNEKQTEEVKEVVVNNSRIKDYRSANLFNYADTEDGYYFSTSGVKTAYIGNSISYVRLDGAGNYVTKVNSGLFGISNAAVLPIFDKDKNYIGQVRGTLDDTTTQKVDAGLSITIDLEGAYYVGFTVATEIKQSIMFVKGTEYPSEYVAFEEYAYIDDFKAKPSADTQVNVLYGKKISFNGDSICAGAGYAGGYGKIIAERNAMGYQNIAVGGATIVGDTYSSDGTTAKHWISRTIANMDADADYAIVEGGVNDASRGDTLGTLTEGYNATLDDTTFYGAFESMLKQLIIRFAGKKYGYIAVHQMSSKFRAENEEATSYYWAAKKCCEKWGVPFLDLNTTVPPFAYFNQSDDADLYALRTTYTKDGDGWHPNEEGYKKYYVPKIEAWLKTI
jgi:lysophospholipase L1-like esterase